MFKLLGSVSKAEDVDAYEAYDLRRENESVLYLSLWIP